MVPMIRMPCPPHALSEGLPAIPVIIPAASVHAVVAPWFSY